MTLHSQGRKVWQLEYSSFVAFMERVGHGLRLKAWFLSCPQRFESALFFAFYREIGNSSMQTEAPPVLIASQGCSLSEFTPHFNNSPTATLSVRLLLQMLIHFWLVIKQKPNPCRAIGTRVTDLQAKKNRPLGIPRRPEKTPKKSDN